jgi:hypothetical protein
MERTINIKPVLFGIIISIVVFLAMSLDYGQSSSAVTRTISIADYHDITRIKTTNDSYPRGLYRGTYLDEFSEEGISKPHGLDVTNRMLPGCIMDPVNHVLGKNRSIWNSFTESFDHAFMWAHEDDAGRLKNGVILYAPPHTIRNVWIFNTMNILGDPFNEKEILIKGVLCGFRTFYIYENDTKQSARARAVQEGIL